MENIGRYRILKELGRGAGGVVYLAEDPKIGRKVAIKTIAVAATGPSGDTLRKRLQREARSAGSLAHPNIVTVFELDDDGPFTFVVMEFVEGVTLRDMMSTGHRIANDESLHLLRQVADGLDFAHARAVVHRDIKPANIMVTDERVVKIADFGVAKILGDATMGLTQAGMAIGTPHYMSPEQVLGKPVTGQSDQFSLGVISYELLTGSRPFDGDSITSIMYQIVNEDPEPRAPEERGLESSALNAASFAVLMRSLAKDPGERYPTSAQFVADLRDAVLYNKMPASAPVPAPVAPAPPPTSAPPAPAATPVVSEPIVRTQHGSTQHGEEPTPGPNRTWWIVGIAVVILAALGVWYSQRPKHDAEVPTTEAGTAPSTETAKPQPPPAQPAARTKPAPVNTPTVDLPAKTQPEKNTKDKDKDKKDEDAADTAPKGPRGTFTWSGTLAGGDSIEFDDNQPASGSVSGRMPPRRTPIIIVEVDPPDIGVDQVPSKDNGFTLRLINSGREVSSFSVTWRLPRKGEKTAE